MLIRLKLSELRDAFFKSRIELRVLRLKRSKFRFQRYIFLLENRTSLFGGYGGSIVLSFFSLELIVEFSDIGVGFLRNQRRVVGAASVLFVGQEQRHLFQYRSKIYGWRRRMDIMQRERGDQRNPNPKRSRRTRVDFGGR